MSMGEKIYQKLDETAENWIQNKEKEAEKLCKTMEIDYENPSAVEKAVVTFSVFGAKPLARAIFNSWRS